MPKLVGIDYYDAVKKGIDEANRELPDLEVIWTGPLQDQVEKQIEILETIIPKRPDLIAVASNDPVAIVPVLKKAKAAGIRVMSWDGDANFREFFVNLVNYDEFGTRLVEAMVSEVGPKSQIAIVTTTFTTPNQVLWIEAIKKHIYATYPDLKILDIRPATESTEKAYRITQEYISNYPDLRGVIVLGVPNVPGAVNAVKDAGLAKKITVIGNATPNLMRSFLKEGTVKKTLLWNAPDHGYLTVYTAYRLLTGSLKGGQPYEAGRLGLFEPRKDEINYQVALPVMEFTRENVDDYHY